jgi:hypothetical protein
LYADEGVVIALCSSFVSQLLLLGPTAAIWAPFVALHMPDGLLSLPGTREAAIQRLLQVRMLDSLSGVAKFKSRPNGYGMLEG